MAKRLPLISELDKCPHCEGKEYYTISRASGKILTNYSFSGEEVVNEDVLKGIHFHTLRHAYCAKCDIIIASNTLKYTKATITFTSENEAKQFVIKFAKETQKFQTVYRKIVEVANISADEMIWIDSYIEPLNKGAIKARISKSK